MIKFFNTLSGKLEEFKSLAEGQVKLYTCGPTVYDYAHIGNFRAFVFEDLLRRFFEYKRFKVTHIMNVTDVDDKTIAGANRDGKTLSEFTEKYTQAFNEDLKTLNILPPTKQPRATLHIPIMIDLIQKLIEKKAAYVSDGSVYYRVDSFKNYGTLSKKDLEKNIKGARVDLDEYEKEEGADFALWKKAREGEPSWDSPWGKGRPGWHIECSAMSMKYLGETFDIHAGGEDLIFPHHENEIAQSEGATGKPFVRYWLHCKHLLVNGEKMSKSKGNYYTLRDLIAKGYDSMAIRYLLLSVNYRQQMNFTLKGLDEAAEVIKKLDECYFDCLTFHGYAKSRFSYFENLYSNVDENPHLDITKKIKGSVDGIAMALGQDLNVAAALRDLFIGVRDIRSAFPDCMGQKNLGVALNFFQEVDRIFGLDITQIHEIPPDVIKKLTKLFEFRKGGNFRSADLLRENLKKFGWLVKDGRPGEPSTIKRKHRTWDQ